MGHDPAEIQRRAPWHPCKKCKGKGTIYNCIYRKDTICQNCKGLGRVQKNAMSQSVDELGSEAEKSAFKKHVSNMPPGKIASLKSLVDSSLPDQFYCPKCKINVTPEPVGHPKAAKSACPQCKNPKLEPKIDESFTSKEIMALNTGKFSLNDEAIDYLKKEGLFSPDIKVGQRVHVYRIKPDDSAIQISIKTPSGNIGLLPGPGFEKILLKSKINEASLSGKKIKVREPIEVKDMESNKTFTLQPGDKIEIQDTGREDLIAYVLGGRLTGRHVELSRSSLASSLTKENSTGAIGGYNAPLGAGYKTNKKGVKSNFKVREMKSLKKLTKEASFAARDLSQFGDSLTSFIEKASKSGELQQQFKPGLYSPMKFLQWLKSGVEQAGVHVSDEYFSKFGKRLTGNAIRDLKTTYNAFLYGAGLGVSQIGEEEDL